MENQTAKNKELEELLPEAYLRRMKALLGQEYPAFLNAERGASYRALRLNPLKEGKNGAPEALDLEEAGFHLGEVTWEKNGYYYEETDQPGRHPYHAAGLYYIQEPSAMAPVTVLDPQPGEKILDLCAAPGGKTTQIAAAMQGQGVLVANEYVPSRAKILSQNVERMGITHCMVVNESPEHLAELFPEYFDKILVDAPCSGEGMFRRNEEAISEWSEEGVNLCARRQDQILDQAARMLAPGGRLVYSTCTFERQEDEETVSRFLTRHREFTPLKIKAEHGMDRGGGSALANFPGALEATLRLWPHHLKGEGHFIAALLKEGDLSLSRYARPLQGFQEAGKKESAQPFLLFQKEFLTDAFKERFGDRVLFPFGDQIFALPQAFPSPRGLKVLRSGLHLGTVKKNRFEPSHALALYLSPKEVKEVKSYAPSSGEMFHYLCGETLREEGPKGWALVLAGNFSIGFGRMAGGMLKNFYPKGLRIRY